jgi:hypothetical protein
MPGTSCLQVWRRMDGAACAEFQLAPTSAPSAKPGLGRGCRPSFLAWTTVSLLVEANRLHNVTFMYKYLQNRTASASGGTGKQSQSAISRALTCCLKSAPPRHILPVCRLVYPPHIQRHGHHKYMAAVPVVVGNRRPVCQHHMLRPSYPLPCKD